MDKIPCQIFIPSPRNNKLNQQHGGKEKNHTDKYKVQYALKVSSSIAKSTQIRDLFNQIKKKCVNSPLEEEDWY